MEPLSVNPAAAAIGTQVVANGVRGLAAGTAATAETTALVPAGAEEVSAHAVVAFASEAVQTLGINAMAQEELSRAGAQYIQAAGSYEAVDAANAIGLV
jgi:hypothetical protein